MIRMPPLYMPSKTIFVGPAHMAAFYAVLDASCRMQASFVCRDAPGKVFFAEFARSSCASALYYLKEAERRREPMHTARFEYTRDVLRSRAHTLDLQAENVIRANPEPLLLKTEPDFALVIGG